MTENTLKTKYDKIDVSSSDLAIIGMSGRFPKAANIHDFWENLCNGIEAKSRLSDEELIRAGIAPDQFHRPEYIKVGFVLDHIDLFDAEFFNISSREAKIMDPQHRLFLECAWEALEHGGYDPKRYDGLIGIFGGTGPSSYFQNQVYPNFFPQPSFTDIYDMGMGNNVDHLTTRVAYKLNLKGPAVTVQNACSTSLVAVGLACQNLLEYQCDMALAGGVKIDVPQATGYLMTPALEGVFSKNGTCRPFSQSADGMVPGCGVAFVLIKRLEDAIDDQDTIYAVIKSAFLNNDGSNKVAFSAPSLKGQIRVIESAYKMAEVDPSTVGFIETHGTGTDAGDLIELGALSRFFSQFSTAPHQQRRALGAVKSNIGHLDTAAGVTSIIKTAFVLKHGLIPPTLHFDAPNPEVDFEKGNLYVPCTLEEWKSEHTPRRAGVSAFGIGGTNAHVVMQEPPDVIFPNDFFPWYTIPISAKSLPALEQSVRNLGEYLEKSDDINITDFAYTLQFGRSEFQHRCVFTCSSKEDALALIKGEHPKRCFQKHNEFNVTRNIIFMFPGTENVNLFVGRELYQFDAVFQQSINECAEYLRQELDVDITVFFLLSEEEGKHETDKIKKQYPFIFLCLLFICEYALAKLWINRRIIPSAFIGHSLGEYVAATLSGVLRLKDALKLVILRGKYFHQMPEGKMFAVNFPEDRVDEILMEGVSVAAINAPARLVLSGGVREMERLRRHLKTNRIPFQAMPVSRAGHSSLITEEFQNSLTEFARSIPHTPPQIPYISSVTGNWITEEDALDPGYWARHLRQTVHFSKGIQQLLQDKNNVFLEVGPGQSLSAFIRKHKKEAKKRVILASNTPSSIDYSELYSIYEILGRLWVEGIEIDWEQNWPLKRKHRIPIPTYAFQKKRHWMEPTYHK
jgi:acyl transferase domain-containing protein